MKYEYSVHYDSHLGQSFYDFILDHEISNDDFTNIEDEIEFTIGCDNVRIISWKFVRIINTRD